MAVNREVSRSLTESHGVSPVPDSGDQPVRAGTRRGGRYPDVLGSVVCTAEMRAEVDLLARKTGLSVSDVIRMAVDAGLPAVGRRFGVARVGFETKSS